MHLVAVCAVIQSPLSMAIASLSGAWISFLRSKVESGSRHCHLICTDFFVQKRAQHIRKPKALSTEDPHSRIKVPSQREDFAVRLSGQIDL